MIIKYFHYIKKTFFLLMLIYWGINPAFGNNDTIPDVVVDWKEKIVQELKAIAAHYYIKSPRATSKVEWETLNEKLRANVIKSTGVKIFPKLPLNIEATDIIEKDKFRIENIYFQTRPEVYSTANLYVPSGEGPFPAVLIMMGHSRNGKLYESYQVLGQILALNGYVALCIDPWGAGERGSKDNEYEYHGGNIGASLLNVGETLMGMQITDNMRGVDLLHSLPYVDKNNIGATGASGGGNQTMWVAAVDERIKAVVPVVSVGSFNSYIVNSNCICELWLDGLCHSEEFNVLGLIAPRALLIANGLKDANPSFYPSEMLKTYMELEQIYDLTGNLTNLKHCIADIEHGYHPVFRRAMLGWFDFHLKGIGDGTEKEEIEISALPEDRLKVFGNSKRSPKIVTTPNYIISKGNQLKKELLSKATIDSTTKKKELLTCLRVNEFDSFKEAHRYPIVDNWERIVIETETGNYIPLVYRRPKSGSSYTVVFPSSGKKNLDLKELSIDVNKGIIIVDLWGLGERESLSAKKVDGSLPQFHTLSRSMLWLGKTIMGTWVQEINIVAEYVANEFFPDRIEVLGDKEVSLAALFASIYNDEIDHLRLINTPISYIPFTGISNFYNMSIHVPGIINWGDLSFATTLANKNISFQSPRSFSGEIIDLAKWDSFMHEIQMFNKSMANARKKVFIEKLSNK